MSGSSKLMIFMREDPMGPHWSGTRLRRQSRPSATDPSVAGRSLRGLLELAELVEHRGRIAERERSRRIETRAREALSQLVERIDAALDAGEDAEDPSPTAPGP